MAAERLCGWVPGATCVYLSGWERITCRGLASNVSGNGSVGNIVSVSSHVLGKLVAAVWSRGLVREEQSTEEKEKRQEKEGVSVRVCECECASAWVSVCE